MALKIPAFFNGLVITEVSKDEVQKFDPSFDLQVLRYRNAFVIQGEDYSGYIIAEAAFLARR
jgi:hypothetical protein